MSLNVLDVDALLVGGGIMSATLGVLLKQVAPERRVLMVEALDELAAESSQAWNNAGTGHAALCELNYTPQLPDGSVSVEKAVQINEQFQASLQFWSTLVERGLLRNPREFLNSVPHMSYVAGAKDVAFLYRRFQALREEPLFRGMVYSDDPGQIEAWAPLMMDGRERGQPVAMTRAEFGTDVDFGSLTRKLVDLLREDEGFTLKTRCRATGIRHLPDGRWRVELNGPEGKQLAVAKFVFLGAGGGALPLLQASGIAEGSGYGGFPVSGQWLRCTNRGLIERHSAKVYGKAAVGAPPMSVPHLDTRMIAGQRELLFGPFAGFSTKFLKGGSFLDLPRSVKPSNLFPMVRAGLDNVGLTKYLIGQVTQSPEARVEALRAFVPKARNEDWRLEIAGQRVQIIKKDPKRGGKLEFGTEVIRSADGSLAALLGASPGASVAVSVMAGLLESSLGRGISGFAGKMQALIPTYGVALATDAEAVREARARASAVLGIGQ
jgi:malate dehydrogenase (quinone)